MSLTEKQKEKLALLIDSGRNTYADLHEAFPFFENDDWYDIIGDSFQERNPYGIGDTRWLRENRASKIFIYFERCPESYTRTYQFQPSDKFELSINGENLLYRLKKEQQSSRIATHSLKISEQSLEVSKNAAIYAKKSYIATLCIGIISIAVAVAAIGISLYLATRY